MKPTLKLSLLYLMFLQTSKGIIMTEPKCKKVPRSTIQGGKEVHGISAIQCAVFCDQEQFFAFSTDDSRCVLAKRHYHLTPVKVSLRLINYPNYVMNFNQNPEVCANDDSTTKVPKAVFEKTFGMLGASPNSISLRSPLNSTLYLYHEDSYTYMRTTGNPSSASWIIRPGNADPSQPDWISLESVNLPGHFLRHSGFRLLLAPFAGDTLFRADSTFNITVIN